MTDPPLAFHGCGVADLERIRAQISRLQDQATLLQAPRRERGAWVRPGLAGSAAALERRLLAVWTGLEADLAASLRGRADDLATGRLVSQDADEDAEPVDRERLAALLVLLGSARLRYAGVVDAAVRDLFARGHRAAFPADGPIPSGFDVVSHGLRDELLLRYDGDVRRLFSALSDGTPRGPGVEAIVGGAGTLGAALTALASLFVREEFRVGMLAEAATWTAWQAGFRGGAVERTRRSLLDRGLDPDTVSVTEVPADVPRYRWRGPDDEHVCDPCRKRFGAPVVALTIADLPEPEKVCRFGLACRHWWAEEEP